jgi:uncharacterized repeat protein (TIGR01451 family)
MSRGIWWYMSARTRRSLTLLWTALFVCSLLMQYAAFAAPAPIAAVHDEGIFELDGNALDEGDEPGDDWQGGTPGASDDLFIPGSVEKDGADTSYFTGGGSKDENLLSEWAWTSTDVAPDKDELLDVFAAVYENGATRVYFGADKFDDSGDAQIGFWFFQDNVSLGANGAFSGTHTVGDVLVLSDFTNGGSVDLICVYEWNPPGGGDLTGTDCDTGTGDNLTLVAAGAECDVTSPDGTFDVCAVVNPGPTTAPWAFLNKDGESNFGTGQFFEGGINLDQVFGGDAPCFSTFLAETRSSQETDAQLKDFALGSLNTCVPPTITTQSSVSTADFGQQVTDTATLSGSHGAVTGTVAFFICTPTQVTAAGCPTGSGSQVGSAVTIVSGSATSSAYTVGLTAAAVGKYCWRAEYTPDANSQYLAGSHTNATTECFTVAPATIDINKVANPAGPVSAGDVIGFDITVTNNGTGTALGVSVSDPLPAGVDWSAAAPTGSTTGLSCAITGSVGSETLNCTKPSLAAGQSFSVHISGTTDAADCGTVSNTASVSTTNDGSDSSTANVVVQCPDVKVTKTPDGGSVNAGEPITWTIKVENIGTGTATGVSLTDNLPAGIDWSESEADCTISGSVGSEVLSCTVGTLASGASKTYTVTGTTDAADCGTINNTATASATNEPSNVLANNSDGGSVEVLCAQIDIEKSANPAGPVNAGDTIGWDIVVTNGGAGTATSVSVTDNLPAGVDWTLGAVTGDTTGVTCAITGSVGSEVLSCSDASMAGGDSFTVHVSGATDAADCGTINNTASVTTGNDGSDSDGASVVVNCPDLEVVKTGNGPLNAGDVATFTITVTNHGPGAAYNTTLSDQLPAGTWTLGGADAADCSISGTNLLTCDFGTLADDASAVITVSKTTTAADCGTIPNEVSVAASNENTATDQFPNSDDASIVVNCPDLEVVKIGNGPLSAGQNATFTITVTNHGPGTAYDVTLSDQLPAGSWTLGGADAADCAISGTNLLTCDFGDLADEASAVITVTKTTTADDCGTIHNEVTVAASNENTATDQFPNTDDADIVVNCPDLQVVKTGNGPVSAGEDAVFTITVTNLGPGTAFDVTLEDELPAGIEWVLGGADAAACDIDTTADPDLLACDFGTMADDATRTITLTGETDAADCGSIPNLASVEASNEPDDLLDNNEDDATVVVQCAQIVITKTADDPVVNATDEIGFTITVTNNGAGTAFGVTVTDTLPTDAGLSWSIDGGANAADCDIALGVLTCDFGSMATGTSKTVHISSPTTQATCGTVDNLAAVSTSNDGSDDDDSSIEVLCADIDIDKVADDDVVVAGEQIGFVITIRNTGEGDAYGVEVSDVLPTTVSWSIEGAANGFSIVAGELVFGPATLAAGGSASVHIVADTTRQDCAVINNTAEVTTTNDGSDEASDSTRVRCPEIDITKNHNDTDGVVGHGQTVKFTINVDVVEGPVTDAVLTDTLPVGQTYKAGTQTSLPAATTFTVSGDGRTLTWTWASLAGDAVVTYDVVIASNAATGSQTNVAEICVSEVPDCEDDDATVRVPLLTIDKSFTGNTGGTGPGGIQEAKIGDTLTYTLAYDLTNGPVTNGVITDVIPVGLQYVTGSATNNDEFTFSSYNAATRTLTWLADDVTKDGSVTYQVKVLVGADELPQPLVNVASIDSNETDKDDDEDDVFVEPPPQIATATPRITLPPTSTTLDGADRGATSPGQTLMLVLLGLAGLVLAVGFVTPVPERARRRGRRR